jgi:ketosteroid isomerase-like protein
MIRKKGIFGLMALASLWALTGYAQASKRKAVDQIHIREQIDNFAKAFRDRDINLMMSLYAADMVSFDVVPPLQDIGTGTYRKTWEKTFRQFDGPINVEVRDLNIVTGGDVAFSYSLFHVQATMANGHKVDFWERMTLCFRKVNSKWLIVHEHVSVPVDLAAGKAALTLTP